MWYKSADDDAIFISVGDRRVKDFCNAGEEDLHVFIPGTGWILKTDYEKMKLRPR